MEQRDYVAEGYGIADCYEDTHTEYVNKACESCGVPFDEHPGLQLTCKALRKAEAERDAALAKVAELEGDAELGRLVRAMPPNLCLTHGDTLWWMREWSGFGWWTLSTADTPEWAIRAAVAADEKVKVLHG